MQKITNEEYDKKRKIYETAGYEVVLTSSGHVHLFSEKDISTPVKSWSSMKDFLQKNDGFSPLNLMLE